MRSIRCLFACAPALALLSGPGAYAQSLLGNSFDGILYDINVVTGAATNPRSTGRGVDSLIGIAAAPDGTLYSLTTFAATPANALVAINPMTGSSTTVGATGLFIAEGDLAFDPTSGMLFGMQSGGEKRYLFTVNVATGAGTVVGELGGLLDGDFSAMTFSPGGTLYALDSGLQAPVMSPSRLLTVDKSTAAITSSVTLSVDLGFTAGMDFHPLTGALYVADGGAGGGTDSLYTLNPATGALTLIGPTGLPDGLAGLAFVVPEPGGAALISLAAVVGVAMRRSSCWRLSR